jgi:hypothetical protein
MEARFPVELGPVHAAAAAGLVRGGPPIDHMEEMPAIAALERRGFTCRFLPNGDRLRLSGTDRRLRPEHVRILDYYRFEGTSDPDDMSVLYALETRDGVRGILIDAYGSYADPDVAALLDRMRVAWEGHARVRPAVLVVSIIGGLAVGLAGVAAVWAARRGRPHDVPSDRRAA